MKTTKLYIFFTLLLILWALPSHAQIVTEINYHNKYYHIPNTVSQSFDGSILVECTVSQNETIFGSRLLKFNRLGNCTDSLLIDDEALVKSFIFSNPTSDVVASIMCADNNVSVRIRHLDEHLAIIGQSDVLLPVQWSGLYSERFFIDKNNDLIIAINDTQRQNYRLARISSDGNLIDFVEVTRFEQLKVTFAGTPFFHYSESPLQYGFIAMPTQGSNTSPHLFILDYLFNVVSEHPIATINGANVNYSNMQAVARLNNDEWLYSCRMGLQSDGEFYNQLTKFDNQLNYQADFQIHNEGTQGNTTSYPIAEGSVKVTQNGTIFHACMDYLMFFPGYLNISCLNPDLTLRWQYRYPDEPETPYGLNMCVLDDGTAVVCGYSRDDENDNYDMFLLLLENEGESITESENDIKVELYPNPGTNILTIKTTLPNSKIEIYDLNGKLIHNTAISHNVISINSDNWPSGTYFWKLISNSKIAESGKWIKQ